MAPKDDQHFIPTFVTYKDEISQGFPNCNTNDNDFLLQLQYGLYLNAQGQVN